MTEASEPADAAVQGAARAALLRLLPPSVFRASVVAVGTSGADAEADAGFILVTYSLAGRSGAVRLSGTPPVVLIDSDWRPAHRALLVVFCAVGAAAAAVAALVTAYSSQHEWFARYGHGAVVGALGLLGVMALIPAAYGALLPREAWSVRTVWAPASIAIGLAFAASISCHLGGPSLREARSLLGAGDPVRALLEAQALIDSRIDPHGGRVVVDMLHLQQARASRSVDELARSLRSTWYDDAAQREAVALLRTRVPSEAATDYAAGDASALDRVADLADSFDPESALTPRALGHLVRAKTCGAQSDWKCAALEITAASGAPAGEVAATREAVGQIAGNELRRLSATVAPSGDIRAQRYRLDAMVAAAQCAMDLTGQPTEPSVSRLQAALTPLQQQIAIMDKRAAAAADAKWRQQEALDNQRRAQEAAAQRVREAQDREASRLVLCSDGSYSGCLCHADSHQGCCSHHGGVVGCAP
jgi:hypothetical protein